MTRSVSRATKLHEKNADNSLAPVATNVIPQVLNKKRKRAEEAEPAAKRARPDPKPAASKPAAVKPAARKPAAVKPAARKPAAVKPAAVKPAARKPAAVKPAAVKPAAVKPADRKPADRKPADRKPADRKPVATIKHAPRVRPAIAIPAIPTWVNSEEQAEAFLATRARENAEREARKKKFIQSELEERKLQRPLSLVD
jgi:hypothetical protein